MDERGIFSNEGELNAKFPMRTPSTNKTVWLLFVPRMNTEVLCPAPPFDVMAILPNWEMTSVSVRPVAAAMSWRVMTVTSLSNSLAGVASRVAVTVSVSCES